MVVKAKKEQGDGDVVAKAWHHALHGGLHIAGACRDARDAGVEGGTVRTLRCTGPVMSSMKPVAEQTNRVSM